MSCAFRRGKNEETQAAEKKKGEENNRRSRRANFKKKIFFGSSLGKKTLRPADYSRTSTAIGHVGIKN
jgi:hypothetical protein